MGAGIIAVIVICSVIVAALLVVIIGYAALYFNNCNKVRPETIDNPTGFVKAYGNNLYDGDGRILVLKGVNLGNWFVQEGWMRLSSVEGFETGEYTQQRGIDAMAVNHNVTSEQAEELDKIYMDNFIRETDFANIKALGMNCVRLPFTYRNIADMEANTTEESFHYLDWALDMCEKFGLFAIVDLHGAYGSQNMDHHSGDDIQFNLYCNDHNEELTIKLWKTIAARYKDRKCVAAYDLLNEPRKAKHKFGGKVTFDFYDGLYKAVREVDTSHMIMMECFTFPSTAPASSITTGRTSASNTTYTITLPSRRSSVSVSITPATTSRASAYRFTSMSSLSLAKKPSGRRPSMQWSITAGPTPPGPINATGTCT
ncbi:MAG: cellulase family glycosylhydrolase [Clostridia bacterium]|nr:cellulase family glycosylhydrolase [Clostridia bacterium]